MFLFLFCFPSPQGHKHEGQFHSTFVAVRKAGQEEEGGDEGKQGETKCWII